MLKSQLLRLIATREESMGEDARVLSKWDMRDSGSVSFMVKPFIQNREYIQNLGGCARILKRGRLMFSIKGAKLSCAKSVVSCETCLARGVCMIHYRLKVALKALEALDKLEKFEAGISKKDLEELKILARDKKPSG